MNQKQESILKDLSWNSTADQIKSGFIAALQETDHQYLLQPTDHFDSWENASILFLILGDEEIKPYLADLLNWLQDLNWPGAQRILDRLQRISSELLAKPLELAAKSAAESKDETWLSNISILIANPGMNKLLDPETFTLLKPFAADQWQWDYDKIAEYFHFD